MRKIRIAAGDNFNVLSDEGDKGIETLPANLALIVGDLTPLNNGALGRDHWTQTYHVFCPVTVSDDSTADSDQRAAQRLAAEVVKQVQEDYQRGALALNTRTVSIRNAEIAETPGVYVTIGVHFWTLRDDPFTQ